MRTVILKVRSKELMQTIFVKQPARLLGAFAGSRHSEDFPASEDGAAQSADCADPATAPNTSTSAKHSHSMFIHSRGDMVKHEMGVCVYMCVRCACAVNLQKTSPIMIE